MTNKTIFSIYIIKTSLTWWFNRKTLSNRSKLVSLRAEKKKILEKVMETETYKVARDILDKFAPDQLQKTSVFGIDSTPSKQLTTPSKAIIKPGGGELRQRNLQLISNTPAFPNRMLQQTPIAPSMGQLVSTLNGQGRATPGPSTLPLPRTILSRDRSVMERMVEYLVGDGPSNRFALICKQCNSHNGMALKEEFEYIAFRCCYCYNMNPARKQRPDAPRLDFDATKTPNLNAFGSSESSDSERNSAASDSDSESDVAPVISEEKPELNVEEKSELEKKHGEGDEHVDDSIKSAISSSQTVTNSYMEKDSPVKTE